MVLLAGCSGEKPDPIKTKYYDADRRFGQSVDGGFADLREIVIPPETDDLTLRASFLSDAPIEFTFRDPDGALSRVVKFPGASAARELQWVESESPKAGKWKFGISCQRHCEYAFGFYFESAVVPIDKVAGRYSDADKRFAHESEGATEQRHSFEVPEGTEQVALKWSADADGGFSFLVKDAMQNERAEMSFPDDVGVDDLSYMLTSLPETGTWTFELVCDARCDYAFGFYFL